MLYFFITSLPEWNIFRLHVVFTLHSNKQGKMMKKIKCLKTGLFIAVVAAAQSASATVYSVVGGTFTIDGFSNPLVSTGGVLNINEGSNAYQGFGEILDPVMFAGSDINVFTAASVGAITGGDAPSGSVVDGGSVDMSAFFVNWNSNNIYQGGLASVSATADGFRLDWQSTAGIGPKTGQDTFWTLDIKPVPVPAAAWLMLSGFSGLIGLAAKRRRTLARVPPGE